MTSSNFNKLEQLLQSLPKETPDPGLHDRIMIKAQEAEQVGRVVVLRGEVSISRKNDSMPKPAVMGDLLFPGDRVRTSPGSQAFLILRDGSKIWLDSVSHFELTDSLQGHLLKVGCLLAFITPRKRGEHPFRIQIPGGWTEVLGTLFELRANPKESVLMVYHGKVRFGNDLGEYLVTPDHRSKITPETAPTRPVLTQNPPIAPWTEEITRKIREFHIELPVMCLPGYRPWLKWIGIGIITTVLLVLTLIFLFLVNIIFY